MNTPNKEGLRDEVENCDEWCSVIERAQRAAGAFRDKFRDCPSAIEVGREAMRNLCFELGPRALVLARTDSAPTELFLWTCGRSVPVYEAGFSDPFMVKAVGR